MMSEWICLDYDARTSQTIKAILIQEGVGGWGVKCCLFASGK